MVRACCAAAAVILALGGCYASTEPATDISIRSAKLHARGTANNGPASAYFEYGPTSQPGFGLRTGDLNFPAGASGPFSATTAFFGPLYADTEYRFRVCGRDEGLNEPTVCAQTRTFRTPAATRDAVLGGWRGGISPGFPAGETDASADPNGANPTGRLRHQLYEPNTIFSGRVTCLRVSGRTGVIGAVGQRTTDGTEPDPNGTPSASSLVTVVDGGPGGSDRVGVTLSSSTAPPDCGAGPSQTFGTFLPTVNVYDAS
jgi:hypothetical protein